MTEPLPTVLLVGLMVIGGEILEALLARLRVPTLLRRLPHAVRAGE
jgi:hypothetical protein